MTSPLYVSPLPTVTPNNTPIAGSAIRFGWRAASQARLLQRKTPRAGFTTPAWSPGARLSRTKRQAVTPREVERYWSARSSCVLAELQPFPMPEGSRSTPSTRPAAERGARGNPKDRHRGSARLSSSASSETKDTVAVGQFHQRLRPLLRPGSAASRIAFCPAPRGSAAPRYGRVATNWSSRAESSPACGSPFRLPFA